MNWGLLAWPQLQSLYLFSLHHMNCRKTIICILLCFLCIYSRLIFNFLSCNCKCEIIRFFSFLCRIHRRARNLQFHIDHSTIHLQRRMFMFGHLFVARVCFRLSLPSKRRQTWEQMHESSDMQTWKFSNSRECGSSSPKKKKVEIYQIFGSFFFSDFS